MHVTINLLLWAHFIALALGIGGGLAMSQVGPRLVAAGPDERQTWWPLAGFFSRIASVGLVLLLVTGPLMIWLKYGGVAGLNGWFTAKMALLAVAILAIGASQIGMARLRRGDEAGGRLMAIAGPITMVAILGVVLAAVFAFD